MPRGLFRRCEEVEKGGGGIGGLHEVFADEEGVETRGAEVLQVGVGAQAGFSNGEAVIRDFFDQFEGCLHPNRKRFQIAIIDADDARVSSQGPTEFAAGVNFDERLHLQFTAEREQVVKKRVRQRGDNQEKAVGVIGARFPDLPGIENEILTESGKLDLFAGIAEIFQGAAEEFAFREDGESRGSCGF